MTRGWAIWIAICIGFGLAVSIATAWSSAFLIHKNIQISVLMPDHGDDWGVIKWTSWKATGYWTSGGAGTPSFSDGLRNLAVGHSIIWNEGEPREPGHLGDQLLLVWLERDVAIIKRSSYEQSVPGWAGSPATEGSKTVSGFGWPFRCLKSISTQSGLPRALHEYQGSLRIHYKSRPAHRWFLLDPFESRVPLLPIWHGLILNSLIYAAPLCLLGWTLTILRSRHRHKRGHCPNCNYDLLSDFTTGCPECGWDRQSPTPAPASINP